MDAVLLAGLALAGGVALALAPLPSSLAAVALACLLRSRLLVGKAVSGFWVASALLLLMIGGARARHQLDEALVSHGRAAAFLSGRASCELVGRVSRSPVVLRHGARRRPGHTGEDARVDVDFHTGHCDGRVLAFVLRARLYGAPLGLGRGDQVRVATALGPVRLFWDPGLSDPRSRLALTGVVASGSVAELARVEPGRGLARRVDEARQAVRRRIEATFSPDLAPFARALVLGETDLSDRDREAFRVSGLAHLLAVSGTHLVLVVVALSRALQQLLVRIEWLAARVDVGRGVAAFCGVLSWLYADFAGGGGSAFRAAAMLSLAMAARALGRRPSSTRAFAWSLFAAAAIEPLAMADLSFALSVAATSGLLACRGPLLRWLRGAWWGKRVVGGALLSTMAAMAGCAPVLLTIGPTLPVLGVAANVLAAPVGELAALPLCLAHAVLWWAPAVERGCALLASGALAAVRAVASSTADSGGVLWLPTPTAGQLAVGVVGGAVLWLAARPMVRWAAAVVTLVAVLALEATAVSAGSPTERLRITTLDVGQGDCHLVDLPDGRLMLVDGGGLALSPVDVGRRVLLPELRSRRRGRVDVVVLTHPHPDHFGGLLSSLPELEVGELWHNGQGDEGRGGGRVRRLLETLRQRGVVLRQPGELCGQPRELGGAAVEVLAPCPAAAPGRSVNDNSIVLALRYGQHQALLTGDAEVAQERELLARHSARRLRSDLLKVGHHGSRTSSTPAFLAAVRPAVASVSCGSRNRHGHPHAEVLTRLEGVGARVLRTDRGGAIVWESDGQQVTVSRAR